VGLSFVVDAGAAEDLLTVDPRGIGGRVFISAARMSAKIGDPTALLCRGLGPTGDRDKIGRRLVWR
jgi:hypothetical protein